VPRSTTLEAILDPPTFLPLSGGGGSRIRHASSRRPRSTRPDQRRTGDPSIFYPFAFNQHGPLPCHVIFCSIYLPPLFRSMWSLSSSHRPTTTCRMSLSPHTSALMCPLYLNLLPLPLMPFRHVSSLITSLTPHHFISHPHSFSATTPIMCSTLHAGLHAYSSSRSVIPGGSVRSLPCVKGVESAGPFSIPMNNLLR
jgi:hypothetical protein